MKYQSELIKDILEERGHEKSSLHYQSECIETWIEENKGAYPKLCDYQSEWLNYIVENPIGKFPYETIVDVSEATVNNVVPFAFKSAILKGSTKYLDIDTGEILETFEDGRNFELVSVQMPGLTTSNEDGTKTNILSTSEDVTLRGIGDVKDTLDCLTGEVVERIGEFVLDGSDDEKWTTNSANYSDDTAVFYIDKLFKQKSTVIMDKIIPYTGQNFWTAVTNDSENHLNNSVDLAIRISKSKLSSIDISGFRQWLSQNPITVQHTLMTESIKTVGLTVINQDGETLSKFRPIEGTMNIATNGTPIKPTVSMEIPVEATNQNLMSFIEEE